MNLKFVDNTLKNLNVISLLEDTYKLIPDLENNSLTLDNNYYTQSFIRYIWGYNRKDTLKILNKILSNLYIITDYYFNESLVKTKNTEKKDIINKIIIILPKTIIGLIKLKNTYINDNNIYQELDIIINKFKTRYNKINQYLNI